MAGGDSGEWGVTLHLFWGLYRHAPSLWKAEGTILPAGNYSHIMAGIRVDTGSRRVGEAIVERDVPARMRDGTVLFADIYRPAGGDGPWPVILIRQPYGKGHAETFGYLHPSWYAAQGYLVVSQDVRGRGISEGEFYPFRDEMDDGYDTVEWVAGFPDASGQVGMYGFSYGGMTQLLAAAAQPPHLTCICPAFAGSQAYEGWAYNGEAFALAFNLTWAIYLATMTAHCRGLSSYEAVLWKTLGTMHDWWQWLPMDGFPLLRAYDIAPYFFDWIEHPVADAYWDEMNIELLYPRIRVPALHIGGWYDIFRDGTIRNYRGTGAGEGAGSDRALLMGPWYHSPWSRITGPCDFGESAGNCVDAVQLLWFDRWLKGRESVIDENGPVRVFLLGEKRWATAPSWPPGPPEERVFYLRSGGRANSLSGDGYLSDSAPGGEPSDIFVYDPRYSIVPSIGGQSCCIAGVVPMGPADQRPVEALNEVLVYTSQVFREPLTIAGPVKVHLSARTDVPSTDFTAKLVDVHPDGRAINLTSGILRVRVPLPEDPSPPLRGAGPFAVTIDAGSTAATFLPGHRVRLEISSCNFPCWDRNTNSGGNPMKDSYAEMRTATQEVFHDAEHPSCLVLPAVPAGALKRDDRAGAENGT